MQEVATKIKYLGLTRDEVATLFSQTAAEQAMQTANDNSALKNSLDQIQRFLVDPKTPTTTSGGILGLDFSNLDFGNGFDFSSFMGNDSGTISNQRGAALFDTARARCATIRTDCQKQGVDVNLMTAYYDLEIDKQCIAYERALIDSNDQMKQTIRNAQTVLQQARLMVAQSKNKYDLKGCVNALDSCMQDEFVCGDGYKNCLDVEGKYIVNGEVVIGSSASQTNIETGNKGTGSSTDKNAALRKYLIEKIGTIDSDGRSIGMCSSVLNQCQNYTFNRQGYMKDEYDPDTGKGNRVLTEYINRTAVNINAKQIEVLLGYGETCRQDIITCVTRNGASQDGNEKTTIINSCKSYIETCASANGLTSTGFDANSDVARYVCPSNKSLKKSGQTWGCS